MKVFEENYGFASGYPEDVKQNKKVIKFAEEFEKYSPNQVPVDLDEEDPDASVGFNAPIKNSDALYGKKLEYMQQNPIRLEESKAGLAEMFTKPSE